MTSVQTSQESEALVVRVDGGASDPKVRRFRSGSPVATLTIGSQGAWKVEAPGIASVHAYLRFDGRELLVATADPRRPVLIDGRAVPETWSLVYPPCQLNLGGACLSVERASGVTTPPGPVTAPSERSLDEEEEPTRAVSMPAAAWPLESVHDPSTEADVPPAEATRLQFGPLESPDHVGTRAVQVSSLLPTSADPSSPDVEGELRARESEPPAPTGDERRLRLRRLLQIGGLALGSVLFMAVVYRVAGPRGDAPLDANAGTPASSAVAPSVATAAPPTALPPLFVPSPELGSSGSVAPLRGQITLERRAADAFAAGDFPTALRIYRDLAEAHPDQPAFRQAVKILEQK